MADDSPSEFELACRLPDHVLMHIIANSGMAHPFCKAWLEAFNAMQACPELLTTWLSARFPTIDESFLRAAWAGKAGAVRILLGMGANLNYQKGRRRESPLYHAAVHGHVMVVELLLDRGVEDIVPLDSPARTGQLAVVRLLLERMPQSQYSKDEALLAAACNGHCDVVRLLFKSGADVHTYNRGVEICETGDALCCAAANGDAEMVRLLLELNPSTPLRYGWGYEWQGYYYSAVVRQGPPTPALNIALRVAAIYGQTEVVRVLLDSGADFDMESGNALKDAAIHDKIDVVQMLLACDMYPTAHQESALIAAARHGRIEVMRLLLAHCTHPTARLHAALVQAAHQGMVESICVLLDHGVDVDVDNNAALHAAVRSGRTAIAKFLIERGASVHADDGGMLRMAVSQGRASMARLLLEHGASLESIPSKELLLCAVREGRYCMIRLFQEHGLSLHEGCDEALRCAADYSHLKVAHRMVRLLLDMGADVHGDEALCSAVRRGNTNVVRLLLERGADAKSARGAVLQAAAGQTRPSIQKLLGLVSSKPTC